MRGRGRFRPEAATCSRAPHGGECEILMVRKLIPVGTRFGFLVALRPGEDQGAHPTTVCRCECGKEVTRRNDKLRAAGWSSCGCVTAGSPSIPIKVGERYGRLTVQVMTIEGSCPSDSVYRCLCDCGNTTEVTGANLRRARGTRSCGCLAGYNMQPQWPDMDKAKVRPRKEKAAD